jgi:DNA-directed RNA polymerase sigma subunit (sigma70/sigma32)
MCKEMRNTRPCSNYQCRHNLFWEGLGLNMDNIEMTDKALRIRNCCRLIREPWTCEEIARAWGLTEKKVKRFEESAWRKLHRETYPKRSRQALWMTEQNTD